MPDSLALYVNETTRKNDTRKISAEVAKAQGRRVDEIEARRRKHSLLSTLNYAMF
ncbi:hypothetical protein GCM10011382_19920 [Vreelandella lutescens]|uniref:Uncharacterized protein n=1 Tax=Vreelandella lutescens TaxID=1602943 RepID=A0ABQ1P262_9GAMM|nr:hypothetical protein GCM10011382_19920 [Halomonas lutescens]